VSVGFEGVGRMGDVGGDVEDGFDFAAGGAHVEGAGEAGGVFWFLVCHLGVCVRERERLKALLWHNGLLCCVCWSLYWKYWLSVFRVCFLGFKLGLCGELQVLFQLPQIRPAAC